MLQTKLSSKFQLFIPEVMRNDLDLKAGQQFTLLARGRIIELIPQRSVMEARGMLSGCNCADSSEYRDRTERSTK